MSKRALRSIKGWTSLQPATSSLHSRTLRHIPARPLTTTIPAPPDLSSGPSAPVQLDAFDAVLRKQRLEDLNASLASGDVNPTRVWNNYISLLAAQGFDPLPLATHQQVLRCCTPPSASLRLTAARKLWQGSVPRAPHLYESRFQTVIRNIRASGATPVLADFEFILEQFAAVGHHLGARGVIDEARSLGLHPRAKTYGLALQALAHRLTLPCLPNRQARLKKDIASMCVALLKDMRARGVPFVSACIDLSLRILRETVDEAGFDRLVKAAYGFDIAYSDSAPLEMHVTGQSGGNSEFLVTSPLPFSTATLNTVIDTLGRMGRLSKMVEAFEVLTAPLPTRSQAESSGFDDDDDDFGFGSAAEPPPRPFRAPRAEPNTTTYNMLIRWVCKAQHLPFARHYVWQMMCADFDADRQLRNHAHNDHPLTTVNAPRVQVNRGTFVPIFGLANHQKDTETMRWVLKMCNRTMKRKAHHIKYYNSWAERILERGESLDAAVSAVQPEPETEETSLTNQDSEKARVSEVIRGACAGDAESAIAQQTVPVSLNAAPVNTAEQSAPSRNASGEKFIQVDLSVFDVNLDSAESASTSFVHTPRLSKPFSLVRHLELLHRDLRELGELTRHIEDVLGKQLQRVKERLGRRVWREHDIWLRHTAPERVTVEKDEWRTMAGWRPKGIAGKDTWSDYWYTTGRWPSIKNDARQRFRERKAERRASERAEVEGNDGDMGVDLLLQQPIHS